mmetsp:Transcript_48626/g.128245  ORF Transcript_48626/g.128245 Transcript_48626/m.128245 type:complete len:431 (+) Transcript_48626:52-1344(+)
MGFSTSAAVVLAALASLVLAPLGQEPACSDVAGTPAAGQAAACADGEAEDVDVFAAAQLRRVVAREHRQADPTPTLGPQPMRHLGLLGLDGYYWPTQPGDINDLRTWCQVTGVDGDEYECKMEDDDEFGLKIATVVNGTWPRIQLGTWDGLEESFTNAVRYLLQEESVHAIMGNAGWFTWYQYNVSNIMQSLYKEEGLRPKPWLGGSPAMLAALGGLIEAMGEGWEAFLPIFGWNLLKRPEDRLLLLTSNNKLSDISLMNDFLRAAGVPVRTNSSVAEGRAALEKEFSIDLPESDAHTKAFVVFLLQIRGLFGDRVSPWALQQFIKVSAKKIILVPWEGTLGYGGAVVDPGAMYVAAQIRGSSSTATQLMGAIIESMRRDENIVGIIMESTEMPAYSNWVRNITKLPVWDSTVVGSASWLRRPTSSGSWP